MSFKLPVSRKLLGRAGLAAAAAVSLSGCMYDGGIYGASDYGYNDGYGYGYGYDDGYGYGGYDDYYYDDYRMGYPNIGYGGGWYDNYYYPGYGVYVYDRGGRYYPMNQQYRNYWGNWRRDWRMRNGRGNDHDRNWRDKNRYDRPTAGRPPNMVQRPENIRRDDRRGFGNLAPAARDAERNRDREQRRVIQRQPDGTAQPTRDWRGNRGNRGDGQPRQQWQGQRPDGATPQARPQWQGQRPEGQRQEGQRRWRQDQRQNAPQARPQAQPQQRQQAAPQPQRQERAAPAQRPNREGRGFGRMRNQNERSE